MRWTVLAAAVLISATPLAQTASFDAAGLLDRYAAGQYDEAVRPLTTATEDQVRALRAQLMSSGRLWIESPGQLRSHRMLAAAMFALEAEAIRAEFGEWASPNDLRCAGACIIEWACALLHERAAASQGAAMNPPDEAEYAWFAASVSLASGVREWGFLHQPRVGTDPFGESKGHVGHALARFPADARLRLARAQSMASRYEATTEQGVPREGTRLEFPAPPIPTITVNGVTIGQPRTTASIRRSAQRLATLKELSDLANDPVVGATARTRLAYLDWTVGDYADALTGAIAAADQASNADDRYLARYVAGLAAQSSGLVSQAESQFRAALEARPHSQSAAIALAALLFQRGDAAGAYALSQDSLTKMKTDDDPWRLFQYGDFPQLKAKIQAMRNAFTALRAK
jgi:tetratricopeptide (TPR) repeat protein